MGSITLTKRVNAPIERAYAVLTELDRATERIPNIKRLEVLTPGPVGRGTRFRETRMMFGKEATETLEITDVQPGRSITFEAGSCGARFSTTFTLTREGSGTLIEQVTSCTPVSFLARLMTPLSMLMMKPMKKMMQADLDHMALAMERGG
ncbi:MAG: SRPBCC family protein [Phycisphaerae bacterium]|nr:SRPBCC family protein [Phycisphaerae bacterium]